MPRTFLQVEKSSMSAHRRLIKKSSAAAQVLDFIWETMDENNCLVVSQTTLASLTGISQATISRGLKILESEKWIQRIRIGTQPVIVANASVVWSQARNKKNYAYFKAMVLASADEQKMAMDELSNLKIRKMPRQRDVDNLTILDDEEPPTQPEIEY